MLASDRLREVLTRPSLQVLPIPHPSLRVLAQNVDGRPAIVIDAPSEVAEYIDGTRGIRVSKRPQNDGTYIRFESDTDGLSALFASLVDILLSATDGAGSAEEALIVLLEAFDNFKAMLAARGGKLGENAIRGLFAELSLLIELLENGSDPLQTMLAWQGPYRDAKDFILPGGSAIEVKSIRRQKHRVQIANLDQLDPRGERLTLAILPVDRRLDGAGMGLLDQIEEARSRLGDEPKAVAMLADALAAVGLDEDDEYYAAWRFDVGDWLCFRVASDFPRIPAGVIPSGVVDVRFGLDIDALRGFSTRAPWQEEL